MTQALLLGSKDLSPRVPSSDFGGLFVATVALGLGCCASCGRRGLLWLQCVGLSPLASLALEHGLTGSVGAALRL